MASAQDRARIFDLLIVGGGVNGCGLARDAAGRGLSVYLCEKGDLGSGTSSASTKLIHGGLRYLEFYQFRLVRQALAERDRLLSIAPHIVTPRRFVVPHDARLRAAWRIRAGLFLYDHLGGASRLPISIAVDLRSHRYGRPLKPDFPRGFVYSDCWVDDARLVLLNAVDAANRGARIATRTTCTGLRRQGDHWVARLRRHGMEWQVRARALVNAAGPWVEDVAAVMQDAPRPADSPPAAATPQPRIRLVRGSHIVVPRLFQGQQAYLFQGEDRRVVFVIPFQDAFTLIGTTDEPHPDPAQPPAASPAEIAYLCSAVNRYLKRSISAADIVSSFSGIRPLFDDGQEDPSAVSRDYVLHLDAPGPEGAGDGAAPVLTIYGGKITTYRQLAERVLDRLAPHLPALSRPWTDKAPLPGGDLPGHDLEAFIGDLILRHPGLDRTFLRRIARRHGSLTDAVLDNAKRPADLGRDFGGGLTECEIDWLHRNEWAETAEDILWRRTKTGLFMSEEGRDLFADWFEHQIAA